MPDEKILTEKTKISIAVSSWWHLIVLVTVIIWWGSAIKISIDTASEKAEKATQAAVQLDNRLREIEVDIRIFHQRYDDDMNRYIRDYSDPNRVKKQSLP